MPRREQPLVWIDPTEWVRFKKMLDQDVFGKTLLRQLRAKMKELGGVAVDAAKKKLDEPTPLGNEPGEGLAAIAAMLKTQVSFSKTGAGVRITATAARLPQAHKGLLKAYNSKTYKQGEEKSGRGNPYFGAAIYPVVDKRLIKDMREALAVAAKAIGARAR